jgi:selenocysteine lyase/cysteine desulfurase
VAAAAYKWLLGPYSLGFLYAAPRHQNGVCLEHNWITREGAEDFAGLVRYREGMQPGARRYDVGERANFALMPAARAALAQLLAWGTAAIQQTLADFNRSIAEAARDMGLAVADDSRRAGHFLGLRHPRGFAGDTLERLKTDGVFVSIRGDSLRVTPHLYNHEGDARRLLAALERLVGRLG